MRIFQKAEQKKNVLGKEEIEKRLLDVLKGGAYPWGGLMVNALLPHTLNTQENQLAAQDVLKELCAAGKIEFNGGWYRLLK
jgi:hypothetical protein